MAINDNKLTSFTFNHVGQADALYKTKTSAEIKTALDSRGVDLQAKHNALIDFLQGTTLGNSGAEAIGIEQLLGQTNVMDILKVIAAAGSGTVPPDGTITIAKIAADLEARFAAVEAGIVPVGACIPYMGLFSGIPSNFKLCDGTNGTPNMTGKFIMGTVTESEVGDTGGNSSITLTESQLPSHTHTGTTAVGGAHTHTVDASGQESGSDGAPYTTMNYPRLKTCTTSLSTTHTHTFTTAATGSGATVDITNPYYKSAFIMRMS